MAEQHVEERIASFVRGYHVYNGICTATVGDILCYAHKTGNALDRYAVSVLKDGNIVGHLPKKVFKVCCLFLRCGGSVSCEIAGTRRSSRYLQQGGLEVLCILIINGRKKEVTKVKRLVIVVH